MSLLGAVRFLASAHGPGDLPPDVGREVAFGGRSNAGKSSAINALTRRRRLAFASKTPGRTQTVNFFDCGGERRLVDLPGYGYAAVPERERAHWGRLVSDYLQSRRSLAGLVLIVDARRGLTALDRQLIAWYSPSGLPLLVLLTKADKLKREAAAAVLQGTQGELDRIYPPANALLFSATAGTGVRSAQSAVQTWLTGGTNKKPPVKGE
jgi:GTP-binding protein